MILTVLNHIICYLNLNISSLKYILWQDIVIIRINTIFSNFIQNGCIFLKVINSSCHFLGKETEIDSPCNQCIYHPGDGGIEQLPVGIGFVVRPAPASMGNQSPQRYQKQSERQGDEPFVFPDEAEEGKPGLDEGNQLDVFQANNRFTFLFHFIQEKSQFFHGTPSRGIILTPCLFVKYTPQYFPKILDLLETQLCYFSILTYFTKVSRNIAKT